MSAAQTKYWLWSHTDYGYRSGGVYIVGGGGKIEINNTFEERLKMCETDALPSVRVTLFGHNDNRHFKD